MCDKFTRDDNNLHASDEYMKQPNDAFAQYFIGHSYLFPVSTSQVGVFNVTFEPGCRKLDYVA